MKRKPDIAFYVVGLSAVFISVVCYFTVRQNIRLAELIRKPSVQESLVNGDFIPSLEFPTLHGQQVVIPVADSSSQLIQLATVSCSECTEQVREWWPVLHSDPRLRDVRPTLVFTDSMEQVQAAVDPSLLVGDIVAREDEPFKRAFRAHSVPTLALLSQNKQVVWLHNGVMNQLVYDQLIETVETMK